ncbi:hypothetical protein RFI_09324 [Reticulomyxa filosa]|uniref:Uncharacterized protein n=1 Tax=Reticulomyxa filosa TaxID=46433 RepID=X6NR31_RETFI|nr:hypothetical protein RFI_09324 [Reticulomyxa filosa]|eukprot:ETO27807.1 hypothetical protein RFI_09324 [Reticulomyxa filosa]
MSVRAVKWTKDRKGNNLIFIGCLDGSLCCYEFNEAFDELDSIFIGESLFDCKSPINIIQSFDNNNSNNNKTDSNNDNNDDDDDDDVIINCGTSGGQMFIFQFRDKKLRLLYEWTAHPPVHSEDQLFREQFGSLHKSADIWSSIWSCRDRHYLLSASEDQSSKLWKLEWRYDNNNNNNNNNNNSNEKDVYITNATCVQELKGHSSAVTSVDWAIIRSDNTLEEKNSQELIATCADDRTIMIWKVYRDRSLVAIEKCDLIHIFKPQSVLGWFTFTYLRFLRNQLACGTENGYVLLFDMIRLLQTDCKCFHRGSIEGLQCDLQTNTVVVCASDCTVGIYSIKTSE